MRWLAHYGILGQRWGQRRFQNSDGTLTEAGKKRYSQNSQKQKTIFVSGSSKTQDTNSIYYRKELPIEIRNELIKSIASGDKIVVGDAPGIDRQVQDFLKSQEYNNVEIYGPGKEVRYVANKDWKTNPIDDPEHEPYSKEWLAKKDEFMTAISDKGLAVILDEGSSATRKNVDRLLSQNKDVQVFMLDKDHHDRWTDPDMATSPAELVRSMHKRIKYKDFDKLMSPQEVASSNSGSCHDQVMYEIQKLKNLGLSPKALFVMESAGQQGGMTHSLVYFFLKAIRYTGLKMLGRIKQAFANTIALMTLKKKLNRPMLLVSLVIAHNILIYYSAILMLKLKELEKIFKN